MAQFHLLRDAAQEISAAFMCFMCGEGTQEIGGIKINSNENCQKALQRAIQRIRNASPEITFQKILERAAFYEKKGEYNSAKELYDDIDMREKSKICTKKLAVKFDEEGAYSKAAILYKELGDFRKEAAMYKKIHELIITRKEKDDKKRDGNVQIFGSFQKRTRDFQNKYGSEDCR